MSEVKKGAGDTVLDLDKLVPPSRLVKICGEVANVARVPAGYVVQLLGMKDEAEAAEASGNGEKSAAVFMEMLKVVAAICGASNPKITVEFLAKSATLLQIQALVRFLVAGVVPDPTPAAPAS